MNITGYQTVSIASLCIAIGAVGYAIGKPVNKLGEKPKPNTVTPQSSSSYDWALARQRLERLGVALQLYREEAGSLPVAARRQPSDAGLPRSFSVVVKPNQSWTVERENLYSPSRPAVVPPDSLTSFTDWVIVYRNTKLDSGDLSHLWSQKGENLVVVYDTNMYHPTEIGHATAPLPFLALRLNGQVEVVLAKPSDLAAVLEQ